jgi:hypothetical protein
MARLDLMFSAVRRKADFAGAAKGMLYRQACQEKPGCELRCRDVAIYSIYLYTTREMKN